MQQATFATGGGAFGTELPVRMISESLDRLRPDGLLLVVMTAPVVRGRAYVRDALEQACDNRDVDVQIPPLISEYEFEHAAVYRRNRISRFVRYVVAISPAARRSIRLLPGRDLRFIGYRARSAAVRAVAGLSRTR